jgi:hypothetical protein
MTRTIVFGFALLASASALAQTTSVASNNPAPKGDPNRIVCEVDQPIGSRLGAHKVCKTALQWQQQREEHRESIERIQQNSNVGKPGGG